VLLLSGGDDQGYGPAFHDVAARRLARHQHRCEHLVFEGAGHLISPPPYGPTTSALTRSAGWRAIAAFLASELAAPRIA
jgi:BAAT / Acyl-CoA thioester hydrolase C terminal